MAYAPNIATVTINGAQVTARLQTDYPFRDSLRFAITTSSPVSFPLFLRIPAWATKATIRVSGGATSQPRAGTFYRLEREWRGTTEVLLTLPMHAGLWRGFHDAVAIERGPLVYALKMGEEWRPVNQDKPYREPPHADWEVYPTTPWNYALDVSPATLAEDVRFAEHPLGDCPFSPEGAPVSATVQGRRVPEWHKENGSAADAPPGPLTSTEPLEELTLIPYGCTNLRITEFPVLRRDWRMGVEERETLRMRLALPALLEP